MLWLSLVEKTVAQLQVVIAASGGSK